MENESKDEEFLYELLERETQPYIKSISKEKRELVRRLHRRAARLVAQSEELSDKEFREQVDKVINQYSNESIDLTEAVLYRNFDGVYLAFIIQTLLSLRKDFQPPQPYIS